jgi:hypothetical protein
VLKVSAILVFVPQFGYMAFAFLLAGYYIFTVGIAAARVFRDLRTRMASTVVA